MATSVDHAKESFQMGLAALKIRSYREAASHFQKALDLTQETPASRAPKLKYASYFGLALTLANGHSDEGLILCEKAVKQEFLDADLYCNLGIVALRNRNRKRAFEAFRKGLAIAPRHPRILAELGRYDRRRTPVFGSLPRNHFLNRMSGLLLHRLGQKMGGGAGDEDD